MQVLLSFVPADLNHVLFSSSPTIFGINCDFIAAPSNISSGVSFQRHDAQINLINPKQPSSDTIYDYIHGRGEILEELILATPVSLTLRDVWRWQGDIRGVYTVRHGYRLLTSTSVHADLAVHFVEWRKLWNLPVPPKVKNLLWRCMRNILPVRTLLRTRRVWAGGGCPFCHFDEETMDHLFCSCPAMSHVWHGSPIQPGDSLLMLLNTALCNPCVKVAVHIAARLWLIWNARNDAVWKGKSMCVEFILRQAESLRDLWISVYSRDAAVAETPHGPTTWSPPPAHHLKCNVDAALFEEGAGYGLVVRSHTGDFVAAHNARLCCLDVLREVKRPGAVTEYLEIRVRAAATLASRRKHLAAEVQTVVVKGNGEQ
nr:uncharacterized protein LOC109154171 [Ipomoea batatas]